MKHIIFLLALLSFNQAGGTLYACKNAKITLYSEAPIENIEATSVNGTSVLNAATGEIAFSIPIRSFHFHKSLMEEHFNENYMESDKYPNAAFKGRLQTIPDLSKDGAYPVRATGTLDVHGVKQDRTIDGRLVVKAGVVSLAAQFNVKCADHHIDIPKIVFHNIAETIQVNVTAVYAAYKNQ